MTVAIKRILRSLHGWVLVQRDIHPDAPRLLLVTSKDGSPNIYDLRNFGAPIFDRNTLNRIPDGNTYLGSMWSPSGNQYMALRNKAPPGFYDLYDTPAPIVPPSTVIEPHKKRHSE